MLPNTIPNKDRSDDECTSAENFELHIVRESLDDLFDPEKPETKQFEENVWFLDGEMSDRELIDSLASFYTFANEDADVNSCDFEVIN